MINFSPLGQYFKSTFDTLTKDTIDLACGDYKNLRECEAKIPKAVAQLNKVISSASNTLGNRRLIEPLLKLSKKIAE